MPRSRLDWSRKLPRQLMIPKVMKLKTLTDVRALLHHVPKERRALETWQIVARHLEEAAAGADPIDVSIALRMVLDFENVPCRVG